MHYEDSTSLTDPSSLAWTPSSSSSSLFITFSHVVIRDREATFHWCQRLSGRRGEELSSHRPTWHPVKALSLDSEPWHPACILSFSFFLPPTCPSCPLVTFHSCFLSPVLLHLMPIVSGLLRDMVCEYWCWLSLMKTHLQWGDICWSGGVQRLLQAERYTTLTAAVRKKWILMIFCPDACWVMSFKTLPRGHSDTLYHYSTQNSTFKWIITTISSYWLNYSAEWGE